MRLRLDDWVRQMPASPPGCRRADFARRQRRHWITCLCVGLFLCFASICARADTQYYFYDSNGNPVNVTALYIHQDHYLYDPDTLNVVATIGANDLLYDLNGLQIGYCVTGPGSGG